MQEKWIQSYVARITPNDVMAFASKYGISLSEKETAVLYQYVKKDWKTVLYGNPAPVFDSLKKELDPFHYQKIEELYVYFKNKFQSFL